MSNTPHPDETALMDMAMACREIAHLFARDGQIDPDEQAALTRLDRGRDRLDTSFHRRVAVESWLRNGNTDRTRRLARRADLLILDGKGSDSAVISTLYPRQDEPRVAVIPFPHKKKHPNHGNGPDAA